MDFEVCTDGQIAQFVSGVVHSFSDYKGVGCSDGSRVECLGPSIQKLKIILKDTPDDDCENRRYEITSPLLLSLVEDLQTIYFIDVLGACIFTMYKGQIKRAYKAMSLRRVSGMVEKLGVVDVEREEAL